ncbi:MAG: M15 family metallopeptidase [Lawsonibacter sp.]|nr:M15 family metallopeptidase [Lawsonibacter sp.]
MRVSRPFCRLLAAAAGLSFWLFPVSALALPREEPNLIPAVASISPLVQEDPSTLYRAAARRLTALGMGQEQINILWSRVGPPLSAQLDSGGFSAQALDYLLFPFCEEDQMSRYLSYAQANPQLSAQDVVINVNIGLDRSFYTDVDEVPVPGDSLILVNKYHALPQDYIPELVLLNPSYGIGSLTPEAAAAFIRMAEAARLDDITLFSVSAYRSYSTQQVLYQRYAAQFGQAAAETFSARAGYSEHQTGLALDINTASFSSHFETTAEFSWLQEHCAEFGFLLRYPQAEEAITGYSFEPWHYRYVGVDVARICTDQHLTYEEYLARRPVPGSYQIPDLFYQGNAVDLGGSAILLDGTPYLSAARLAPALGWSAEPDQTALALSNGPHRITLAPGRRFVQDGLSMRLTSPALDLGGELYLSLSDLCAAMRLNLVSSDRGLELSPSALPWPTVVSG